MADLNSLDPWFYPYASAFLDWLKQYDHKFTVTSARRTTSDQARLYADWQAGRPGVYGALPPGRSQHERGLAFDMARYGEDPASDEWLHWAGAVWRQLGGVWGGGKDPVHFEAPRFATGR